MEASLEIFPEDLRVGKSSGKDPDRAAVKIFSTIFDKIVCRNCPSSDWMYDFHIKEVTRKSNKDIFYFRGSILETDRGGLVSFEPRSDRINGSNTKSARKNL